MTADELPAGGGGMMLETRLSGAVIQHASTTEMIYETASLILIMSEPITREADDLIVTDKRPPASRRCAFRHSG